MFTNFKIDQTATFNAVVLLSCEPKIAFGSRDRQETTKDGTPKWEAQVVATTTDQFGKPQNAVLKVGFTGHVNPAGTIQPYTPIQFKDFEVGVMEKTKRNPETGEEKVIGVTVWYRAQEIRSLVASSPATNKAA